MQILNTLFPYGAHDSTDFVLIGLSITGMCFAVLGGLLILVTRP